MTESSPYEASIDLLDTALDTAVALGSDEYLRGYLAAMDVLRRARWVGPDEQHESKYFRLVKGEVTEVCDYDVDALMRYVRTRSSVVGYRIEQVVEHTSAKVTQVWPHAVVQPV